MFKSLFNIGNYFYFHKDNDTYIKIFSRGDEWKPKDYQKGYIGFVKTAKMQSEVTDYVWKENKFELAPFIQTKEFYVVELIKKKDEIIEEEVEEIDI